MPGSSTVLPSTDFFVAEMVTGQNKRNRGVEAGIEYQLTSAIKATAVTSLPIPYAQATYPAKPLIPILGGLLTLESEWKQCFGEPLKKALAGGNGASGRLDLGCVAAHGHFVFEPTKGDYDFTADGKPATAFLFKLISLLQFSGRVPMIDIQAYGQWLTK